MTAWGLTACQAGGDQVLRLLEDQWAGLVTASASVSPWVREHGVPHLQPARLRVQQRARVPSWRRKQSSAALRAHPPASHLRLAEIPLRGSENPTPSARACIPGPPDKPPLQPSTHHGKEVRQLQMTFAREQNVSWNPFACAIFIITTAIISNEPL